MGYYSVFNIQPFRINIPFDQFEREWKKLQEDTSNGWYLEDFHWEEYLGKVMLIDDFDDQRKNYRYDEMIDWIVDRMKEGESIMALWVGEEEDVFEAELLRSDGKFPLKRIFVTNGLYDVIQRRYSEGMFEGGIP